MTQWSVHVVDATTGEVLLSQSPGLVLRTASVAKVLVLTALAEALESGSVGGSEVLPRSSAPAVADSGLWHLLALDALPVGDVAALVGAVSDNLATNVLVARLGLDVVQAIAPREGLDDTQLWDVVRDERGPGHPSTLSTGTAQDWAGVFSRLHQRTWVSPAVSDRVLTWLAAGVDHSLVASAFALDPLVVSDTLVNKTGADDDVRCDVGLAGGPRRTVAYACLANGSLDGSLDGVVARMRDLGAQVRHLVG